MPMQDEVGATPTPLSKSPGKGKVTRAKPPLHQRAQDRFRQLQFAERDRNILSNN